MSVTQSGTCGLPLFPLLIGLVQLFFYTGVKGISWLCMSWNSLTKLVSKLLGLQFVLNIHVIEFKIHVLAVFSNIPRNILVV